jgi:hypothetical protein
VPYNTYD